MSLRAVRGWSEAEVVYGINKLLAAPGVDVRSQHASKLLAWAARAGHANAVSLLLQRGATLGGDKLATQQLLEDILVQGRTECVRALWNAAPIAKQRALVIACSCGHADLTRLLLDRGADPFAGGGEALMAVVKNGRVNVVNLLVNRFGQRLARIADDQALVAAASGSPALVKRMMQLGCNVNAQAGMPLRQAVASENMGVIKLLLRLRADANADGGNTLTIAARNNNLDACKLLLTHGADVNSCKALLLACEKGNAALVKLLVAHGADPKAHGGAALVMAAEQGRAAILKMLLRAGGRPVTQPGILHAACAGGHLECVRLLVQAGADVEAPLGGKRPLSVAAGARRNALEVCRILLAASADADANRGQALAAAGKQKNLPLIKLLVQAGADASSAGGGTALFAAAKAHDVALVRLLLEAGADATANANAAIKVTIAGGEAVGARVKKAMKCHDDRPRVAALGQALEEFIKVLEMLQAAAAARSWLASTRLNMDAISQVLGHRP